jgi:hypothetical protein
MARIMPILLWNAAFTTKAKVRSRPEKTVKPKPRSEEEEEIVMMEFARQNSVQVSVEFEGQK